jgi:hypothetical protein
MYNINHTPIFDKERVCELYTQKDKVPINYVCSTEMEADNLIIDVFYRETPHPEFKNRYFGLFRSRENRLTQEPRLMIRSADNIESYIFDMIECNDTWYYSRARHDYMPTPCGSAIDGGRAYTRTVFSQARPNAKAFVVLDGKMIPRDRLILNSDFQENFETH